MVPLGSDWALKLDTVSQLPILSGSTEKIVGQFPFEIATPGVVYVVEEPQLNVRNATLHCRSSAIKCIMNLRLVQNTCHCVYML